MDPGHIFRQGLESMPPRPTQSYSPQHQKPARHQDDISDEDGSGPRVAHTLTACCRCRQVRSEELEKHNSIPSLGFLALSCQHTYKILYTSVKPAVTRHYLDVFHAKDLAQHASIWIRQKARRSIATMSSNFRTRFEPWKLSWLSTRTTIATTLVPPRILCDQGA